MKFYKKFIYLVVVILIACKGSKEDSIVLLKGNVRYISGSDQAKVQLHTYKLLSDTIQKLDTTTREIYFQGQRLAKFDFGQGTTYNFEISPMQTGKYYISTHNASGEEIRFDFYLQPIEKISPKLVSKSKGLEFDISINAGDKSEGLILTLLDSLDYTAQEVFDIKGKTSLTLQVPASRIQNLHNGSIRYYFVKKEVLDIKKGDYRLSIETEYYTKEQTIELH